MRIGYCSPFNPMKSGISDFSEELVFALSKHIEVVIFSPVIPANENILKSFEVHKLSELDRGELRKTLDELVYHIGNNGICHGDIVEMLGKYPGIIELHEWGLHNLVAGKIIPEKGKEAYMEMAYYCHGKRGLKIAEMYFLGQAGSPWETHPMDMNMARPYIEQATGIIVHTEMMKQLVLGIRDNMPITKIIHHSMDIIDDPLEFKLQCRKSLGLPIKKIIMGAFGFATSSKRIIPTLDALAKVQKVTDNFIYALVGEVANDIDIQNEISKRGLSSNIIITGFTTLETFKLYMGACDFCLNLRYPTQGETSGSLHRMLGMGKPAIVTDVGSFSDYPDNVVIKVRYDHNEVEDIYKAIILLAAKKNELKKRSEAALEFAKKHCDLNMNAKMYATFFQQVYKHAWQPDWEDVVIGHLCDLNLTNHEFIYALYKKMSCIL